MNFILRQRRATSLPLATLIGKAKQEGITATRREAVAHGATKLPYDCALVGGIIRGEHLWYNCLPAYAVRWQLHVGQLRCPMLHYSASKTPWNYVPLKGGVLGNLGSPD